MEPAGSCVLAAAPDAGDCRRRISEEKVGERVARELARVSEGAPCVVGLEGPHPQMEVIAAELQVMGASIDGDVVEKLEVEIIPRREDGRIAHGAVQAAGRDLRE